MNKGISFFDCINCCLFDRYGKYYCKLGFVCCETDSSICGEYRSIYNYVEE